MDTASQDYRALKSLVGQIVVAGPVIAPNVRREYVVTNVDQKTEQMFLVRLDAGRREASKIHAVPLVGDARWHIHQVFLDMPRVHQWIRDLNEWRVNDAETLHAKDDVVRCLCQIAKTYTLAALTLELRVPLHYVNP